MKLTIKAPSSRHSHLRPSASKVEGGLLETVLKYSHIYHHLNAFGNFPEGPVDTAERLMSYRDDIMSLKPRFKPHLGLMLTKRTTPRTVREAEERAGMEFLKIIFAASSTGSENGISIDDLEKYYPVLEECLNLRIPTLWHWERPRTKSGLEIPPLEREEAAIEDAAEVLKEFPELKMAIEHVSTAAMLRFGEEAPANVIMTVTAHHPRSSYGCAYDEEGEVTDPFLHCMPILKPEDDRLAIKKAITRGNYKKVHFGPDDAPHASSKKLKGAPGIFMPGEVAIPLLAEMFEEEKALSNFESFVSWNETDGWFYGWEPTEETVTLKREEWAVPFTYEGLVPFWAGKRLGWRLEKK